MKTTATLREFILERADRQKLSIRTIAAALGISHSYLSLILSGKRTLDIVLGNKIADYFDVPRIALYEMVGWVDLHEDDLFFEMFKEAAKKDECLTEIVEAVILQPSHRRAQILEFVLSMT